MERRWKRREEGLVLRIGGVTACVPLKEVICQKERERIHLRLFVFYIHVGNINYINDRALVDDLQALAQSLGQDHADHATNRAAHALSWLERFQCHSPPKIKGGYDPDVAMS
ncbi:hypothetical protein Fmac_028429 [Flemingia macrophylla]|uniref:Uncharacterized protein n=1 Tax=Flemingia macrophylla TaxID=520843 RepID=A0ABD1L8W8_9FABA